MPISHNEYDRKTLGRLPGWDDASAVADFMTVCTQGRGCYFSRVRAGKMVLNKLGAMVNQIKCACIRRIRSKLNPEFAWQPCFYGYIIHDERDLLKLCLHISLNPGNWRNAATRVHEELLVNA